MYALETIEMHTRGIIVIRLHRMMVVNEVDDSGGIICTLWVFDNFLTVIKSVNFSGCVCFLAQAHWIKMNSDFIMNMKTLKNINLCANIRVYYLKRGRRGELMFTFCKFIWASRA